MRQSTAVKRSTLNNFFSENDDFLNAYPEFKKNKGILSSLKTISLWDYQSKLKQENRYAELVWIQPNFSEKLVDGMLSVYFFSSGGTERYEDSHNLLRSLNLQQKNMLLHMLNLIDKELFSKLEDYRATRNKLIHGLMKQVQTGRDIDKECKRFCNLGFYLQDKLQNLLWDFIRAHGK